MTLQFQSEAAVGDAELIIALDLDGVQTLLKAVQTALEAGLDRLAPEAGSGAAGDGAPNLFDRVTVTLIEPANDRAAA